MSFIQVLLQLLLRESMLKHFSTIFLLFNLFYPIEVLGQYASPYLNPNKGQNNPASIVWREKSILGVANDTWIQEENSPMTKRETSITNTFVLANIGDFFGFKSGFEFTVGESKSTTEFVSGDQNNNYTIQQFDSKKFHYQ